MQLKFNTKLSEKYKSNSQKARVLTENWVDDFAYCPNCGYIDLEKYKNNKPVADFYCLNCKEDYELKGKQDGVGTKIIDGAYRTMIERLQSSNNPNFFLLNYDLHNFEVRDFFVIPKHFFVPEIIEKRKPLSSIARRTGWIGCNILLNNIPQTGKIFFIRNKQIVSKKEVLIGWKKTLFLKEEKEILVKGWLIDIMRCIEKLKKQKFKLEDMYAFEKELTILHPENKHVKDKIRQQLQYLRNKGFIKFISRGYYQIL